MEFYWDKEKENYAFSYRLPISYIYPKILYGKITRKIEEIIAALALPAYMIITSRGNIAAM